MIKLYGCGSPNVHKVLFFLSETGTPYDFHHVDLMNGETRSPAFLALNPNGKVPVIVDPDGPGGEPLTVFESGAILLYLAEKTGRFWPQDRAARSRVIQWLTFQMAGVGPFFGQAIHFLHHAQGEEHGYARDRYFGEVRRLVGVVEAKLSQTRFVAGEDFSLADMALWPWLRRLPDAFGAPLSENPSLARWTADIEARPGWQAIAELCLDLMRKDVRALRTASQADRDRFLGRDIA